MLVSSRKSDEKGEGGRALGGRNKRTTDGFPFMGEPAVIVPPNLGRASEPALIAKVGNRRGF